MAWTVEELSESKPLPLLKLEKDKPVRLRILSPQIASAIPVDSYYANGTWDKAKHFPPDDVKSVIGARPVDCIGIRHGCIFHEGLLAWDTTYDNLINVVVYDGVDARAKTYTESFILGLNMKLSLWKNMGEQLGLLGYEKNQLWAVDWIIVRTGDGQYNTKYNCTAIPDTLDQEIDLLEFPAIEEYNDSSLPMLIDFRKFYPNPLTLPSQQEEWYNNAQAKAMLKAASDGVPSGGNSAPRASAQVVHAVLPAAPQLPGVPVGMRNVTASVPPVAVSQITMQSTETVKKRGRPAGTTKNTQIPVAQLNPTITQAPRIMSMSEVGKPPTIGKIVVPAAPSQLNLRAVYDAACLIVDPWGSPLSSSQYIEFIVNATAEQQEEYTLTSEVIAAAKLVQAGPPVSAPVVPQLPKLPGQAITVSPVVQQDSSEVDDLRGKLTRNLMSLSVFKNPTNIMSFLKIFFPEGNIRTVRQITSVEMLQQILEHTEQGNEAIAQMLGITV